MQMSKEEIDCLLSPQSPFKINFFLPPISYSYYCIKPAVLFQQ